MEWNENNIEQIVEFINSELLKGRTMKDIENTDFSVNDRVIHKRLDRKGYFKVNNQFIIKEKQHKIIDGKQIKTLTPGASKQKYNNNINMDKLEQLIELLEPIKEVIQEYNKSKNIVEVEQIELKPRSITEVKQKLFKVDVEVLEKWEKFVAEHKQFKVQNLISLALEEFINKYK